MSEKQQQGKGKRSVEEVFAEFGEYEEPRIL